MYGDAICGNVLETIQVGACQGEGPCAGVRACGRAHAGVGVPKSADNLQVRQFVECSTLCRNTHTRTMARYRGYDVVWKTSPSDATVLGDDGHLCVWVGHLALGRGLASLPAQP